MIRRLGNYGSLSALALAPDGTHLYLVGTPGDPRKEADVRAKSGQRIVQYNNTRTNINSKSGTTPVSTNDPDAYQMANQLSSLPGTEVSGIIDDLSRLNKTVTVLDLATGKTISTVTIGSLPQRVCVVEIAPHPDGGGGSR